MSHCRSVLFSLLYFTVHHVCLLCFDAVGWAAGRASGLEKTEWWGAGVVVCLEQGADLHLAQLMPLPLTLSCFSKIQIGFAFLVPAHLGSPRKRPLNGVCVCVSLFVICRQFWQLILTLWEPLQFGLTEYLVLVILTCCQLLSAWLALEKPSSWSGQQRILVFLLECSIFSS